MEGLDLASLTGINRKKIYLKLVGSMRRRISHAGERALVEGGGCVPQHCASGGIDPLHRVGVVRRDRVVGMHRRRSGTYMDPTS